MEESGESLPPKSQFPRCCYPMNSSTVFKFRCISLLVSFYFLLLSIPKSEATLTAATAASIASSNVLSHYAKKCNQLVPESPSTDRHLQFSLGEDQILHFDIAYVTGGGQIVPKRAAASDSSFVSVSFHPKRTTIFLTQTPGVLKLQATLKFHLPARFNATWRRNMRQIHFRPPRIPIRARSFVFELYGFWSMDTGKLCMVGSGSSKANLGGVSSSNVVLKLNYPAKFCNISSLISGVLESFNEKGSLGYFEPISILGIPHFGEYKYTLINNSSGDVCLAESNDGSAGKSDNLHLEWRDPSTCLTQLYQYARTFELEYGRDCGSSGGGKCDPLGFGGTNESLSKFMTVQGIRCEHGRGIRLLIGFSNSGFYGAGYFSYGRVFDPSRMLIGEGMWDEKKKRLCVVACRVMHANESLVNASVGGCSIRLSLWFPGTLTITQRSTVVGQISTILSANESGYFHRIRFHGSKNNFKAISGLKYEYTLLNKVRESCPRQKTKRGRGKVYPDAYSSDMRFHISVKNGKKQVAQGFASPLFVNDKLYEPYRMNGNQRGLLNISYTISFTTTSDLKLGNQIFPNASVQISAEGTYDNETGVLCMIGCLHQSLKTNSVDCETLVNMQLAPLNAKTRNNIKGTIKSMRRNSDPMYFSKLEIYSDSIYTGQSQESIWRMDMEIVMVLISNTLACVFVGLQLYHVKKYPHVLPFISFVMLIVLTLGYMIPLLLNFEALFVGNRNRQNVNVFLESGRWFEVNEVIVRVVTMVAFLLQFRLLQLSWTARCGDGSHSSLWLSEKKVLFLSLPLYICGGVIAWYVQEWKNSYTSPFLRPRFMHYQQKHQWEALKSYAGLILDGFLLPQIIFNVFSNSKEYALASSFYAGKTVVRVLPHAYDLYRVQSSTWSFDMAYIYGNHKQDFYSTAWDIVIPLFGFLFAAFLYLQQRFGGRCILPKRFKATYEYEKVSAVSSEDIQGDSVQ